MALVRVRFLLLVLFAMSCRISTAESRMRWGFEIKNFKLPNSSSMGDGAGFRNAAYLGKTSFTFGFEVFAGGTHITSISNADHVYTGGVSLGRDATLFRGVIYEIGVLTAYSEGKFSLLDAHATGLSIEPSVGLGFVLGDGWRISFRAGYFIMPRYSDFNGFNFGLRLDRKVQTTTKGVNE